MQHSSLETSHPDLFSLIRRSVNALKEPQPRTRKQAVAELLRIVRQEQLSTAHFEELMVMANKQLLKCLSDQLEYTREHALLTLIELISRVPRVGPYLPYLLAALIDRTNCNDLQGIANVPEKMRPAPGQKPKVVVHLVEHCEEIRIQYVTLVNKILALVEQNEIRDKLDETVNILRALVMDPCPEVQKSACETVQFLCRQFKLVLLHYTEIIGRALLLPLVSKKSKIRIAGLQALTSLFWVGLWKYNAFVFENLVGFRDPNSVPIKDFYEPSNNVNYLATFANDANPKVRQEFMTSLKIWTCDLDDKYDHHGRLVPYILSGLIDKDDKVKETSVEILKEIGRQIEIEKQKEFRDSKQYAIDASWTWQGELVKLPVEPPFMIRPSLGSRVFIRGHVRKFWTALYKQVKDINIHNRTRAAHLLVYGIIFTENYMTQYLDIMIPQLLPNILPLQVEDNIVCQLIEKCFFYLGRYCQAPAYLHVITSAIKGQMVQNQHFLQAALRGLTKLVEGCFDSIPNGTGLCHKRQQVNSLLSLIDECEIYNQIYSGNCGDSLLLVEAFLHGLQTKATRQDHIELMGAHALSLMKLLAVSYYQLSYQFKGPPLGEEYTRLKNHFALLAQIEPEYFSTLDEYMREAFMNPPSLMDADWKLIIVVHNLLSQANQEQEAHIFQLAQDVIAESLTLNRSVQILSFIYKYVTYLFDQVPSKQKLEKLSLVILRSLSNFDRFKPMKKVPVYDQHLVKPETDPSVIRLTEDIFVPLFESCSQAIQAFHTNKVEIFPKDLGQIMVLYIKIAKKYIKDPSICSQSTKTLWLIFNKISLNQQLPQRMTYNQGQEKVVPFEAVIDFVVERIETMGEADRQRLTLLFDTLEAVFKCCEVITSAAHKMPNFYPDYPRFLEKMFKYALDEKDLETRQKYNHFVKTLCSKMRPWFELQLRLSEENSRFARTKLLKDVLSRVR